MWEGGYRHPKPFTVVTPKGGRARLRFPLGGIRTPQNWTGAELKCLTTNVLDRVRTEMVVAGPVEQTVCEFRDFDRVLTERMKLTQTVDCTRNVTDPRLYAENACKPNWPNADHKTHVREEKGIAFRETGESNGDWFGYPLDVRKLGGAHILEVDYPETRKQLLYVAIEENYPIGFCNNAPRGGNGHPNASGAVQTGWMSPLTDSKKTLRILFYPGSRNVSVYFENGQKGDRAAVCGFRLYEVPDVREGMDGVAREEAARFDGGDRGDLPPRAREVDGLFVAVRLAEA